VLADVEGVLAQIRGGYVRLSDLVIKLRPLVHNLAETCKDIAVVAGAATAAVWAIQQIIKSWF